MYKIMIYEGNIKTSDEYEDEDELREAINDCLNDLEHKNIKTFCVSWISKGGFYKKPFWEE